MFKKNSIIMAIIFAISLTSVAFAGNNKTEAGSGINPAGKSDKPGFDNGNAWWKNNECVDIVDSLETSVAELEAENEALKAEIAKLKEEQTLSSASADASVDMDAIKFALQKSSEDHPNHPGVVGIYLNMFSYDEFLTEQIMSTSSGEYEVHVTVTTPDGDVLNVRSIINAQEGPFKYRDHWVGIR